MSPPGDGKVCGVMKWGPVKASHGVFQAQCLVFQGPNPRKKGGKKFPPVQEMKSFQLDSPEAARLGRAAQMCTDVSGFAAADRAGGQEGDEFMEKEKVGRWRRKRLRQGKLRGAPARAQTDPGGGSGEGSPQIPAKTVLSLVWKMGFWGGWAQD